MTARWRCKTPSSFPRTAICTIEMTNL